MRARRWRANAATSSSPVFGENVAMTGAKIPSSNLFIVRGSLNRRPSAVRRAPRSTGCGGCCFLSFGFRCLLPVGRRPDRPDESPENIFILKLEVRRIRRRGLRDLERHLASSLTRSARHWSKVCMPYCSRPSAMKSRISPMRWSRRGSDPDRRRVDHDLGRHRASLAVLLGRSRCEITAYSDSARRMRMTSCSSGGNMAMMRRIVLCASGVCSVDISRWPGLRRLDRRVDGLGVAHLADHDDVGILTERGTQTHLEVRRVRRRSRAA